MLKIITGNYASHILQIFKTKDAASRKWFCLQHKTQAIYVMTYNT